MIAWFARIDLPHEFRDGVDHIRDPIDIEEFVFSERQIADTSPKGLKSAHYLYGCFRRWGWQLTRLTRNELTGILPRWPARGEGQPRTRRSG